MGQLDLGEITSENFKVDTGYWLLVESRLEEVVKCLVNDIPLDQRYRDHALSGNWRDHRDCHLAPDLVLIYRLTGEDGLQLVRLGSHSNLGL